MATPNLFLLTADQPDVLLSLLSNRPHLALTQDETGYSLLHAAASYGHDSLLRQLVQLYNVSPNVLDGDGETALYMAETVDIAKILVEELGVDWKVKSKEGMTAREMIESEGE